MRSLQSTAIIRISLVLTLLILAVAFYQLIQPPLEQGILIASRRWLLTTVGGIGGILVVAVLSIASWTSGIARMRSGFEALILRLRSLGKLNLVIFMLAVLASSFLLLGPYGDDFKRDIVRFGLFWMVALAGAFSLRAAGSDKPWSILLITSGLLGAVLYRGAAFLPEVSDYPFSIGWSETSRYFYASLFFSKRIYGFSVPPSVLHPTRYLMQGIAFLIPNAPLWFHRLWQVFLWWSTTFLSAFTLARKLKFNDRLRAFAFMAWAGLYLLIGPVYYHLQVVFILVLATFSIERPWRSLIGVLLASIWAGISRVNWIPMPAMLAISLYMLEKPVGDKPLWRYLTYPTILAIAGVGLAFGTQATYANFSGNPPSQFASSFSSDLLWYRLLPNATYPQGVILASLLLALPVLIVAYLAFKQQHLRMHWARGLSLAGMLTILYTGGLLVSTKIGGGNNLHNLDAFYSLLLVISTYAYFARIQSETPSKSEPSRLSWKLPITYVLLISIFIPIYHGVTFGGPLKLPENVEIPENIERITRLALDASQNGGEVLFIAEDTC